MRKYLLGVGLLLTRLHAAEVKEGAPASARPPAVTDGATLVRKWTAPIYPAEALKAKIGGQVMTRVVVDEVGNVITARILKTNDLKLGEAALTAVKLWKFNFTPEKGKPTHVCIDVPFEFDAAKGQKSWKQGAAFPAYLIPQLAPRTEPVAKTAPRGEYPASMTARRLPGKATFICTVRPDGRAQDFRIVAATHVDFVLPALAALARWEFSAGTQGDLDVTSEMRGTVDFDFPGGKATGFFTANGMTSPDGVALPHEPMPEWTVDPVWPHALLLSGQEGSARVEFTVQPAGRVSAVKVLEASQPEFGRAATAALEQWLFRSEVNEGRTEAIPLVKRVEFKRTSPDERESSDAPLARLVALLREGKVRGGTGLDETLIPVYQVAPAYPAALLQRGRPIGGAVIEFVIDRDGRCRVPRIISATEEEFGWSAATAVGQWIFKAPRRAGQPTEVRVQIPINFTPPDM